MEAKRTLTPVNIFPEANGGVEHDDSGSSFGSDIENKEYFSATNSDQDNRMSQGPGPKHYPSSSPHQHPQLAQFSRPQYTSSDASREKATPDTNSAGARTLAPSNAPFFNSSHSSSPLHNFGGNVSHLISSDSSSSDSEDAESSGAEEGEVEDDNAAKHGKSSNKSEMEKVFRRDRANSNASSNGSTGGHKRTSTPTPSVQRNEEAMIAELSQSFDLATKIGKQVALEAQIKAQQQRFHAQHKDFAGKPGEGPIDGAVHAYGKTGASTNASNNNNNNRNSSPAMGEQQPRRPRQPQAPQTNSNPPLPPSAQQKHPSAKYPPRIKRHTHESLLSLTRSPNLPLQQLDAPSAPGSSRQNHSTVNNLMVSPEVLGRLRKVQENDDEGKYSQSSAGEYTSNWGETDESMTEDSSTETEDEEVRHIVSLNKRQRDIVNMSSASSTKQTLGNRGGNGLRIDVPSPSDTIAAPRVHHNMGDGKASANVHSEVNSGKVSPRPPGYDAAQEVAWSAWSACLTDDGLTYYYNNKTGESQWESPFPSRPPSSTSVPGSKTVSDPAPPKQAHANHVQNKSKKSSNGSKSVNHVQRKSKKSSSGNNKLESATLILQENTVLTPKTIGNKKSTQGRIDYCPPHSKSPHPGAVHPDRLGNQLTAMTSPASQASDGFRTPIEYSKRQQQQTKDMRSGARKQEAMRLPSSDTPLHGAVSYNYVSDDYVLKLLRDGADPNAPDSRAGRTALHIAASQGYFAGMEMLFDAGADPLANDAQGNSVMHHACKGGNGKYSVDVASYLRSMGCPIDAQSNSGNTPLHLAAVVGDLPCVQYLLEFGANPIARNVNGETPAHCAARNGHASCIIQLAEYGAPLDAQTNEGYTVEDVATFSGKKWCAERIALLPKRRDAAEIRKPVVEAVAPSSTLISPLPGGSAATPINGAGNVSHLISSDSDSEASNSITSSSPPPRLSMRKKNTTDMNANAFPVTAVNSLDSSRGSAAKSRFVNSTDTAKPLTPMSNISSINGSGIDTPSPMCNDGNNDIDPVEYNALIESNKTTIKENMDLKKRLILVEEELDRTRRQVKIRENKVQSVTDELNDAKSMMKSFQTEQRRLNEEFMRFKTEKVERENALNLSINNLRAELNKSAISRTTVEKDLDNVKQLLIKSEKRKEELMMKTKAGTRKHDALHSKYLETQAALKQQTIQYAAALEKYERRLSVTMSEHDDSKTRIQQLESELQVANAINSNISASMPLPPPNHPQASTPPRLNSNSGDVKMENSSPSQQGIVDEPMVSSQTVAERGQNNVGAEMGNSGDRQIYGGYEQDGIIHDTAPPSMLMPTEVVHANVSADVRDVPPNDTLVQKERIKEEQVSNVPYDSQLSSYEAVTEVHEESDGFHTPRDDESDGFHTPRGDESEKQDQNDVESRDLKHVQEQSKALTAEEVGQAELEPQSTDTWIDNSRRVSYTSEDGSYTEKGEVDINTWQAWEHNSSPWVGYTSEEGAVYYYNKETGESSWENPVGVTPLQQPGHDAVEDYDYGPEANVQTDGGEAETASQNDPDMADMANNESANEKTDADRIGKIWGKFFENAVLSSESSPARKKQAVPPKVVRMELHGACKDGDVDLLSVLYSQGAGDGEDIDVDELDSEGNTALHIAAKYGHHSCVQFLLESAASPQVKDAEGNTPLHLAAGKGNFAISKLLTTYGASIDVKNSSNESVVDIALTKAMQEAKPSAELMKTIELLRRIDAGEDVSAIDLETMTESSSDEAEYTPDVAVDSGNASTTAKTTSKGLFPRNEPKGSAYNTKPDTLRKRSRSVGAAPSDISGDPNGADSWKFWGVISTVGAFFGNKQDQNYEDGHFGIEQTMEGRNENTNQAPINSNGNDGGTAVVANLGNDNKYVYDKEKQMWVSENEKDDDPKGQDMLLKTPESKKRRKRKGGRPSAITLPPTDAELGPTPPPSVSPRTAKGGKKSPSFNSVLVPPPAVALALAMGKSKSNSPRSSPVSSPRESGANRREQNSLLLPSTHQSGPKGTNNEGVSPTKVNRSQSDGLLDSSFHSLGSVGEGQTDTLASNRSQTPEMYGKHKSKANADAGASPQGQKRNRFSLSKRRGPNHLRSRYVNTFSNNSDGPSADKET